MLTWLDDGNGKIEKKLVEIEMSEAITQFQVGSTMPHTSLLPLPPLTILDFQF